MASVDDATAASLGCRFAMSFRAVADTVDAVGEITKGGAHVSLDALGDPATCVNSIKNLRRRGRHVQVGLMLGEHATPRIPMAQVIGHELQRYGSHAVQAWRYDAMQSMLGAGRLAPQKRFGRRVALDEATAILTAMDASRDTGISVIDRF